MTRDRYQAGDRLGPKGLFQLVAEEVYKDGKVEPFEQRILADLARYLKIPSDSSRRIAVRALERFKAKELGTPRRLAPLLLYERVVFFAWSDGAEDPLEAKMLGALRRMFRISEHTHEQLVEKVTSPGYREATCVEEAPPTTEVLLDDLVGDLGPEDPSTSATQGPGAMPGEIPSISGLASRPSPPVEREKPKPPVVEERPSRAPMPAPVRMAGDKQGSERFPISPGGIPLPPGPLAAIRFAGFAACFGLVWLLGLGSGRDGKAANDGFGMAIGFGFAVYWLLRRAYEASLLSADAALVVSAAGVVLPAAFGGGGEETRIARKDIVGISVSKAMKDRSESVRVLHLMLAEGRRISIFETALAGDFDRILKSLESYLLKPIKDEEHRYEIPTSVGIVILAVLVIMIVGILALK